MDILPKFNGSPVAGNGWCVAAVSSMGIHLDLPYSPQSIHNWHNIGWIASDPVWSKFMKKCLSKCPKCSRALHNDIKTSLKLSWSYRNRINRCDILEVTLERLGAFCQLLEQNRPKSVHPNLQCVTVCPGLLSLLSWETAPQWSKFL